MSSLKTAGLAKSVPFTAEDTGSGLGSGFAKVT